MGESQIDRAFLARERRSVTDPTGGRWAVRLGTKASIGPRGRDERRYPGLESATLSDEGTQEGVLAL
jgi:hypothetical protein